MKTGEKREKTIYDESLTGIFLWSGVSMFVILLIVCVIVGFVIFFYRRADSEGIKLLFFCLALVIPCSYGLPLISLFKVWRQERILGVYWRERTDQERPAWERDWYLTCDRGGFILCHRNYIKRILGSKVESEIGSTTRGMVYDVRFEDIQGRRHSLKFSSESGRREFRQWYEKQKSTVEIASGM